MRSMPQALLWETFSHGRWSLPSFFLLGILLPLLIYGAISGYGVDFNDPSFLVMQFTFLPLIIFEFSIGIAMAQGPISRLYAAPISSHSIVAWHTVSGAIILALETALAAWLFNALFHVGWPVWGPAFFAAAAWSSFQLLLCVSVKQSLTSFGIAVIPGTALLLWLQARYGDWFTMPQHSWPSMQASESATLVGVIIASYFVTVFGVNRARCGEQLPSFGIWKRIAKILEAYHSRESTSLPPFRSANQAQFWYEWKLKGIALPFAVAALVSVVGICELISWYFAQQTLSQAYEAILSMGGIVSVFAVFVGFFMGMIGITSLGGQRESAIGDFWGNSKAECMGSFQGSLPVTVGGFSRPIFKTVATSVAMAWGLWFAAFLAVLISLFVSREVPEYYLPPSLGILFVPLTLLGVWITMANASAIGLSGRGTAIFVLGVFGIVGYVIVMSVVRESLPTSMVKRADQISLLLVCLAITAFAIWAFNIARRVRIVESKNMLILGCVFVLIAIVAIAFSPMRLPLIAYPAIIAFAALVVLPFATIPLAIKWNRHR